MTTRIPVTRGPDKVGDGVLAEDLDVTYRMSIGWPMYTEADLVARFEIDGKRYVMVHDVMGWVEIYPFHAECVVDKDRP